MITYRGLRQPLSLWWNSVTFSVPIVRTQHPMLKRIVAAMGPSLRFVIRHMVMMEIHPFAQFAAEATEAAHLQGKFWAMHDAIYQHQTDLGTHLIDQLVDRLRLDRARFDADLHARRGRARIRYDFMGGMRSGVAGTPTFFINGERYDGDLHERSLSAALQKKVGLD